MNNKEEKIRELKEKYEKTIKEIEEKKKEIKLKEEDMTPPWMSGC